MASNFGDFQMGVYLDAVKGVNSRFSPSNARRPRRFPTGCTDMSRRLPETGELSARTSPHIHGTESLPG
jgi:hypothetical protein